MSYIIETNELTKHFRYKKAVDHVSIHIEKGEIYGLIGKNGAGKTTLLKMLLGLIKPTSGKMILFDGENLNSSRHKIGSLIEAPGLYRNKTAYENLYEFSLLFGADKTKIPELLKTVGLENVGKKKVKAFSLGMKQRLGLAVALIGDPEILLLDEPVNGLDPEGIMSFRNIVEDLNKKRGVTLIISSHLLDELGKIATKYGIINNGVLVEEMTIDQVNAACGTFLEIVTNDNEKAIEIIKANFGDLEPQIIDGHISIIGHDDLRAKINKILVNEDMEILSSTVKVNDPEAFFVERLK